MVKLSSALSPPFPTQQTATQLRTRRGSQAHWRDPKRRLPPFGDALQLLVCALPTPRAKQQAAQHSDGHHRQRSFVVAGSPKALPISSRQRGTEISVCKITLKVAADSGSDGTLAPKGSNRQASWETSLSTSPLPTSLPSPKGKPPLNPSSREPSYIDDAAETKIFPSTQHQIQFARGYGLRAKSYRAVSWPRPSCPGASSVVDQRLTSASTSFPSTAVRRLLPTHPCPRQN
ncbi:hypothetical protein CCHR01_19261 [Colletotrichum chrysophilum]|uniref:Uncharacterized protein n=1 Tax=Colletotrichum chrysophilum TaxID=1836956 RepID=A0AAD9A021_9PEZI|nr:hypothetical protein CCHR01_19261 [Colletotrichum chrysophilum]